MFTFGLIGTYPLPFVVDVPLMSLVL